MFIKKHTTVSTHLCFLLRQSALGRDQHERRPVRMFAVFFEIVLQQRDLFLRQIQMLHRLRSHIPVPTPSLRAARGSLTSASGSSFREGCAKQLDARAVRTGRGNGGARSGAGSLVARRECESEVGAVCACMGGCVCVEGLLLSTEVYVMKPVPPAEQNAPEHVGALCYSTAGN